MAACVSVALLAARSKGKMELVLAVDGARPPVQAVQASLTALAGSMAGVQGKEVDSAVDFVFDTVFHRDFIAGFIEDEYI